jgi:hypothetical protein
VYYVEKVFGRPLWVAGEHGSARNNVKNIVVLKIQEQSIRVKNKDVRQRKSVKEKRRA